MGTEENASGQPLKNPLDIAGTEPGFFERLWLFYTNPSKLFEILIRKPTWFWALVAFCLVSVIIGIIVQPRIFESFRQDMVTVFSNIPNMPEQALEKMNQGFDEASVMSVKNAASALANTVIIRSIAYFVVVTILFLLGSVVFGGTSRYKQVMSLYAWTLLIWALGTVVTAPLMIVKQSYNVSLSLGLLVTPDPLSSLYFLLKNFNLFTIWALAVLGTGLSMLYGTSKAKAIGSVFCLWFIWVLINSFIPFLNFFISIMGLA